MDSPALLFAVIGVAAVSAALLAWVAIEAGTAGLARYRERFTRQAQFQVREFFLFIDPRNLFIANIALMGLSGVVTWMVTGNPLLAAGALAACAMLPRAVYAGLRKRRLRQFEQQLPDALMMLSGGLRAGVGLSAAIQQLVAEAAAPLSQEFTLLLREQRLGVPLEQSLDNLHHRVPTQTTTLVVAAMRIASGTGGGLAETLERTSHTIRARLQMEGKIGALTAQGKLQAWVVGLLPVLLMMVLHKMEPDEMALLWHTQIGWAVLAVMGVLEVLGIYVIRKIIAIDV